MMKNDRLETASVCELVGAYRRIRDLIAADKAEYEEKVAKKREALNAVEAKLLKHLQDAGTSLQRTAEGTAYISTVSTVSAPNWSTFINWVRANDRYDMLERRPSKKEVLAFIDDTGGDLPPGVAYSTINKLNVRKA